MPATNEGKAKEPLRDKIAQKVLAAVLTALVTLLALLMPPIVNPQVLKVEATLAKPLVAVVVAVVVLAFSVWRLRIAVALVVVVILVSAAHGTYYYFTTKPGRDVEALTANWRLVPLASATSGIASNKPNLFGRATSEWSGSNVRLDLHSETGTTQQGFRLNGGPVSSSMYFSADVTKVDGGDKVTCPLLYGIKTNRAYYTFRLQPVKGKLEALSYQIIPNGSELNSGFHGVLLDEAHPLPYVGNWNLLEWHARRVTHLGLLARGDQYKFYVNGRNVFSRQLDGVPTHTVATGVSIIANGLRSDAVCQYRNVNLHVNP